MRTGKRIGGKLATTIRERGQLVASSHSRLKSVRVGASDMDSAGLRPVRGLFASTGVAWSRPVSAASCSWTRTDCCRVCWRGLDADGDCSQTWTARDCARCWAKSGSRKGCCRGREPMMLRGCSAPPPRPYRGRGILGEPRSKACTVLNTLRTTLPPLLQQFMAPVRQLRGDGFNARGLVNRP